MPIFRPPDIDPALTQEAQQVVKTAAAEMESWLNDAFKSLENDFNQELATLKTNIEAEQAAFLAEEKKRSDELRQKIRGLQIATQTLTPLDPEQKEVLDKLKVLVTQAETELSDREKRWTEFGSKTTSLAYTSVKTLLKGVV